MVPNAMHLTVSHHPSGHSVVVVMPSNASLSSVVTMCTSHVDGDGVTLHLDRVGLPDITSLDQVRDGDRVAAMGGRPREGVSGHRYYVAAFPPDQDFQLLYEGDSRSRRHGRGTFYDSRGDVSYVGEWKGDRYCNLYVRHGKGVEYVSSVAVYDGEWENDRRHGNGKWYRNDGGLIYDGEWVHNSRHGMGLFVSSDGSSYLGEWTNDERNGMGQQYDSNNALIYDGTWLNNERNGDGKE